MAAARDGNQLNQERNHQQGRNGADDTFPDVDDRLKGFLHTSFLSYGFGFLFVSFSLIFFFLFIIYVFFSFFIYLVFILFDFLVFGFLFDFLLFHFQYFP